MSTFAPVYRQPITQQSFLVRDHKRREKLKRKRGAEDASEPGDEGIVESEISSSSDSDASFTTAKTKRSAKSKSDRNDSDDAARLIGALSKKDPYYVAGHPRNKPLPGGAFPHAAAPDLLAAANARAQTSNRAIEEELAKLKLFVPKGVLSSETHSTSLKARHVNNLTAIMHRCMLEGDWQRARRAWAILLRIEVSGQRIDIRTYGRWTIGAELLMRTSGKPSRSGDRSGDSDHSQQRDSNDEITDEGFKLARDYYERLILQFPHTQLTQRSLVTARVIYPALFSVWVYEVQHQGKLARRALEQQQQQDEESHASSPSHRSSSSSPSPMNDPRRYRKALRAIIASELFQATKISKRLNEVTSGPPYDTVIYLRRLQGNLGLWTADLHRALGGSDDDADSNDRDVSGGAEDDAEVDTSMDDVEMGSGGGHTILTSGEGVRLSRKAHRERALWEEERAREILKKL
jgi:hypothetical protein